MAFGLTPECVNISFVSHVNRSGMEQAASRCRFDQIDSGLDVSPFLGDVGAVI